MKEGVDTPCEASHLKRRLGQSSRVMCARDDEVTASHSKYIPCTEAYKFSGGETSGYPPPVPDRHCRPIDVSDSSNSETHSSVSGTVATP